MNNQVICDSPRTILNPKAAELIHQYGHYVVDGTEFNWKGSFSRCERSISYRFGIKRVKVFDNLGYHYENPDVPPSVIQNSYIYSEDGQMFPMYIQVPCGHCPNCVMSRQSSFVQRCYLETQSHRTWPWFVTLTYKTRYLPSGRQLCIRDVQNFLKRFRVLLSRKFDGRYDGPIRYAVCGEYGKRGRCHYHLIIWGINAVSARDFADVRHLLRFAWSKRIHTVSPIRSSWYRRELEEFDFKRELIGWITCRVVNPDDKDKTFKYTSKYMCKPPRKQHLPYYGAKRPFLVTSRTRGIGGIGKPYLLSQKHFFDKSGRTKPYYVNKFTRTVRNLYTNRWVIDSLFPSKMRLFPSVVRKSLMELSYWSRSKPLPALYDGILNSWRQYFYDPFFIDQDLFYSPEFDFGDCLYNLTCWMEKCNIHSVDEFDDKLRSFEVSQIDRDFFLFGLFSNVEDFDIGARSYKASSDQARQIALEIL